MWQVSSIGRWIAFIILPIVLTSAQNEYDESLPTGGGVQSSPATLIFNSDTITVNPNQRLNLDCGVKGNFRSCFWETTGKKPQSIQTQDVHDGIYRPQMIRPENLVGNECGIVINEVKPEHHAEWQCKVFITGKTLIGKKKIVVTVRPAKPHLDVNMRPLIAKEGESKNFKCSVPAARPQVTMRWWLGDEDVTAQAHTNNLETDTLGTFRSISTLSHTFRHADHRRTLRCAIEHFTLDEPQFAEVDLDVRFAPAPQNPTRIYGIPLDHEYILRHNFTANPRPSQVMWTVGDFDTVPVPGTSGRYSAELIDVNDGQYQASLKILDFTTEDVQQTYRLETKNELGERVYEITLSTEAAPPDVASRYGAHEISSSPDIYKAEETLSSGAVTAIIIVLVLLVLLLFIAGYMRYRQMYCFAVRAESKAYIQDPERVDGDHSVGRTNDAVKTSNDALNGRQIAPPAVNGSNNGGLEHTKIEAVVAPKKNTDV